MATLVADSFNVPEYEASVSNFLSLRLHGMRLAWALCFPKRTLALLANAPELEFEFFEFVETV
jgi:hypothetical protein